LDSFLVLIVWAQLAIFIMQSIAIYYEYICTLPCSKSGIGSAKIVIKMKSDHQPIPKSKENGYL